MLSLRLTILEMNKNLVFPLSTFHEIITKFRAFHKLSYLYDLPVTYYNITSDNYVTLQMT